MSTDRGIIPFWAFISAEFVVTISSHFYEDNDTSLYYNSNVEFKSGWIGLWSCISSFVVSQDLINWIGLPFVRKHWPCSYEVVVANILWLFGAATSFLLLIGATQKRPDRRLNYGYQLNIKVTLACIWGSFCQRCCGRANLFCSCMCMCLSGFPVVARGFSHCYCQSHSQPGILALFLARFVVTPIILDATTNLAFYISSKEQLKCPL